LSIGDILLYGTNEHAAAAGPFCQSAMATARQFARPAPPSSEHQSIKSACITTVPVYSNPMRVFPPNRIVCLTEETVETLYLLGQEDRIVGVSGYAVRPMRVRREKPRVAAFTSADIPKIMALAPDLVLTFSDLQAPIAAELIQAGIAVHAFNQRNVAGILAMIRTVGALVGASQKAEALARGYEERLADIAVSVRGRPRPKVYFEEWDDPLISGIGWISELIEIAGGQDVFAHLRKEQAASERVVSPADVITAAPEIILASWCGKKVVPDRIRQRPGWHAIPAVRNGRIVEIKSPLILQPGPAALTDGLDAIIGSLFDIERAIAEPS
jgi:iron complex transport system substrate-binding protein